MVCFWPLSVNKMPLVAIFYFIIIQHLCRGVYSFCLSVCIFVRLFVGLFVLLPLCLWNLQQCFGLSFSSGVHIINHLSEGIHIWIIVTLEGWHSHHDSRPQGPCLWVGLEVKISGTFKMYDKVFVKVSQVVYTYHWKAFIFGP